MIKITKDERDYLESVGFKFGDVIHRTYGHNKHYFMTETEKAMRALSEYRERKN